MSSKQNLEATLKVRLSLLNLQKELLASLKHTFEKENGRTVGPGEWLQVIMVSQRYHWLRELTSLVADIDLLTELEEVSAENAGVARSEVERLFFPKDPESDSLSEFAKHYLQLMKSGAPFVVAHGHLRQAFQQLPEPAKTLSHDDAMTERKKWHEEHHQQSRKRRS